MLSRAPLALLTCTFALHAQPTQYYTTAEVVSEIDAVVAAHPAIAARVDLTALPGAALTHDGNRIWALKLSDNVASVEDEPAMVFAAQHHARELNSTHMVIAQMDRMVNAYGIDPELTAVVDGYEIYYVPCMNPDGVDFVWSTNANWRKNRRPNGGGSFGVDINRNYPFLWGVCGASSNPSSDTYKGPSAGSEPETQTLRALFRAVRPEIYIDYHSFGREVLHLYPPCSTRSEPVNALASFYIDDLRTPMNYGTRFPSASGEAPHDAWAEGGAMALLIEIGTSFQPSFASTVTEEARVWPGIDNLLRTWRPTVRGHVRSTFQNQPLEATITHGPTVFHHGEVALSRPRDGRYSLWTTRGTHQVTFSAPGHQAVTKTVDVSALNTTVTLEIELEPIAPAATLIASGTHQVGTTSTLAYSSPGDAGDAFWVTLSGGTTPGLPIGSRVVPLNLDPLLLAMTQPNNGLLTSHIGTLPPSETVNASFAIPNLPIAGLTLYAGGLTVNPLYNNSLKKFSAAVQIVIQP